MKSFQIWDKKTPPPEPYFSYMQSIRDMSKEYTLISPENFMGAKWVSFDSVYQMVPENLRARTNGPLKIFDAMRNRYLTLHFSLAYFDIDVELEKPIELLDVVQRAGCGILIGNGDPKLGRWCWENYVGHCKHFGCRPASMLFARMEKGRIIETGFTHHHAGGKYDAAKNKR